MDQTGKRVARNAGVLMLSQVLTWGLSLLLTTAMSRSLGAEAMGKFYIAGSLWGMVAILATFGMDLMLIKEIARHPERTPRLLGQSIYLRMALFALGGLIITLYSRLVNFPADTLTVIYLIGLANLVMQFVMVGEIGLKGLERMAFVSIGTIASKLFVTLVTILVLWLGYGIETAALVYIGSNLINLAVIFYALTRVTSISLKFSWADVKMIMAMCLPYLVVNIVMNFYSQVDVVVISLLVNEQNVGWYGQAAQLFGTFLFVPLVFNTAIYPSLARLFSNEPDALLKVIRKSFDLMLLMGVPVGLGVMVIADKLVVTLFGGEFYGSGPVLALMGLVLTVTYQNMLLGRYFMAIDRQKQYTLILAGALAITIPLDVLLIPWLAANYGNGAVGGGISYLVTELGILIASILVMPRGVLNRQTAVTSAKIVGAGLAMVASIWWLRYTFPALPVLLGAAVYAAMIVLLRAVPPEDWKLLKSMTTAVIHKFTRRYPVAAEIHGEN